MKPYLPSLSGLLILLAVLGLMGCAQRLYPNTEMNKQFVVDGKVMEIELGAYFNAMPGSRSDVIYFGIHFSAYDLQQGERWPRQIRLTKVKISGVHPKHTLLTNFRHQGWMDKDPKMPDSNTLEIAPDIIPSGFDATVWFEASKGKSYKITFYGCGSGTVY